jgi:hypothetical protein
VPSTFKQIGPSGTVVTAALNYELWPVRECRVVDGGMASAAVLVNLVADHAADNGAANDGAACRSEG